MLYRSISVLLGIAIVVIGNPVRAEQVSINYDCTFNIPMSSVYPPELYDPLSDGVFHISAKIRTKTVKRSTRYHLTVDKRWPINRDSTSHESIPVKLVLKKKRYSLGPLKLNGPLKRVVTAGYLVSNPELYIGGACSSCTGLEPGSCTKVRANTPVL